MAETVIAGQYVDPIPSEPGRNAARADGQTRCNLKWYQDRKRCHKGKVSEYISDSAPMTINLEHWEGLVYITSSSGGAVTCNLPAATEFHNGGKIVINFTKVATNLSIVSEQGATTAVSATGTATATSNGLVWTMS
tara:strand:- start:652 stop:1059 length:408 start_codon:yes stop_codon:yes gene_type:complete